MGYKVEKLLKGQTVTIEHPIACRVEVKQNHLFLYDKLDNVLAVYQSGWWIYCIRVE